MSKKKDKEIWTIKVHQGAGEREKFVYGELFTPKNEMVCMATLDYIEKTILSRMRAYGKETKDVVYDKDTSPR